MEQANETNASLSHDELVMQGRKLGDLLWGTAMVAHTLAHQSDNTEVQEAASETQQAAMRLLRSVIPALMKAMDKSQQEIISLLSDGAYTGNPERDERMAENSRKAKEHWAQQAAEGTLDRDSLLRSVVPAQLFNTKSQATIQGVLTVTIQSVPGDDY